MKQYAECVKDACTREMEQHQELSTHGEILGASYLHLEHTGALRVGKAVARRLTKQQAMAKEEERLKAENEMFEILLVCALAAWIEQTERWYCMPINPRRNLKMVCNLPPLQIRSMGLHVSREYKISSRGIFDHVCASCGRLLYSRCEHSHLPREVGTAGPA